MAKANVKLSNDLLERIENCYEAAGYSSAQEFVEHVIEQELAKVEANESDEETVLKRLQGLGYID